MGQASPQPSVSINARITHGERFLWGVLLVYVLLLVAVVFYAVGRLWVPLRLYYVGELRPALVANAVCHPTVSASGIAIWAHSDITLVDPPVSLAISGCGVKRGDTLQVRYSAEMGKAVVAPAYAGPIGAVAEYTAGLAGYQISAFFALSVIVSVGAPIRILIFASFLWKAAKVYMLKPRPAGEAIVIVATERISMLVFLALATSLVITFFLLLAKAVVSVEPASDVLVGGFLFLLAALFYLRCLREQWTLFCSCMKATSQGDSCGLQPTW